MHRTPQQIIKKPLLSEKATNLKERQHRLCFEVHLDANKPMVRQAVESLYSVKAGKIRTQVLPGKLKRRGKSVGKLPPRKKAWVDIQGGQQVDFLALPK